MTEQPKEDKYERMTDLLKKISELLNDYFNTPEEQEQTQEAPEQEEQEQENDSGHETFCKTLFEMLCANSRYEVSPNDFIVTPRDVDCEFGIPVMLTFRKENYVNLTGIKLSAIERHGLCLSPDFPETLKAFDEILSQVSLVKFKPREAPSGSSDKCQKPRRQSDIKHRLSTGVPLTISDLESFLLENSSYHIPSIAFSIASAGVNKKNRVYEYVLQFWPRPGKSASKKPDTAMLRIKTSGDKPDNVIRRFDKAVSQLKLAKFSKR